MSGPQSVVLFHTTSHAIRAEKLVKQAGMPCRLIPVPRQLSSDCGVCLRVGRDSIAPIRRLLADSRVEIEDTHEL